EKTGKNIEAAGWIYDHSTGKTIWGIWSGPARMYKGLWRIEETFREVKTVFKVRPIRHRRGDRVEVHIWICILAYLIEKISEMEVRREKEGTMDVENLTGENVFSMFDTIVLNENRVKSDMKRVWYTSTELTEIQREVIERLKIGDEAFIANKIIKL
ncbi:MAG: transposase, partial [Thermoplasmata archaeon]